MELSFSTFDETYAYLEDVYNDLLTFTFHHLGYQAEAIISVTIVDNETIHQINKEYRQVDRATDVISFAFMDDDPKRKEKLMSKGVVDLGEIYISLPKAQEQAIEYGHSLERELDFLFVHGLLHLLGYDHMKEEDEKVMFALQEEILNLKGVTRWWLNKN